MGRSPRIHYYGALFHVICRGNGKQDIFRDDRDRIKFVEYIRKIKQDEQFLLYAYCLMTNHIHLLVRVRNSPLSRIMHRLTTSHSHYFNRRHAKTGHLFEDRFKAIHCPRDSYFKELIRYINMNPVKAGLVSSPHQWRWSGYNELLLKSEFGLTDVPYIWSMFDCSEATVGVIEDFVRGEEGEMPPLTKGLQAEYHGVDEAKSPHPLTPLGYLASEAALSCSVSVRALLGTTSIRSVSAARKLLIRRAAANGYLVAEISRFIGRTEGYVSRIASTVEK